MRVFSNKPQYHPLKRALQKHVEDELSEATVEIGEAIHRGMVARRILDGVVQNENASDVGKFNACLSASHIDG